MKRRAALFVITALAGCSGQDSRSSRSARGIAGDSNDAAFAQVQVRGRSAMGVDQYTSTHHFESLPDGGRISLVRDSADSAGVAQIRHHMWTIALAFSKGNFEVPGFVHDREVPGTAVMALRRSRITYRADSLPHGGQLRILSTDSAAVAAIHEFLAFQRQDHRSGSSH